ncbi:hypothetical protein QJS10_CPA02g00124 [Acorus calamus]|uniref:Geranylgeranyl transferase type-2 subunit alpha n=1 Tax=Acorus calamus TaxID=4465 RepID=A0AAV9FC94_ACOCL|nr:hypothetical protein QJS10_CPA02g00124 [Acorus calamus]
MHGQPRKPARIEDAAVSTAKAEALRNLQTQFIHNHRNRIYTDESIEVSTKLLEVNPEIYTAWNYRKLAVQNRLGSVADPEAIKSVLDEELRVVKTRDAFRFKDLDLTWGFSLCLFVCVKAEVALKQNPKAYGAWHHRKWVLKKGHSSIDRELRLLGLLLKLDGRNFHGWNHMR